MNIDIEQCRENDKIKEIISSSGLPVKHIKLLLRLSDAVYLNALSYNVLIDDGKTTFVIISSKPDNEIGVFNTTSLSNVLFKLRELKLENEDIKTQCRVENNQLNIEITV